MLTWAFTSVSVLSEPLRRPSPLDPRRAGSWAGRRRVIVEGLWSRTRVASPVRQRDLRRPRAFLSDAGLVYGLCLMSLGSPCVGEEGEGAEGR